MRRRGVKTTLSWGPCFRLLWSLLSLSLLVPAVSGEVHQRFRPTDTTRLQDTATITDTHLTDTGWLHFLTLTDTGLLGSQDTQDVGTHPTSKTLVERRVSETWTGSSLSQSADSTNTINLVTPAMEHYLFHLNSIKRLRFPKRNNKPEINKLVNTIRKKTKLIHRNILNKRKKYNKRRRIRRNSSTFSYSTLLENDTQSAHSTNTTRGRNNQDRRQETARHPLRRRTDRARVWTDKYPDSDKSTATTVVEDDPAATQLKEDGDLVAEESLSAPIFVTIVQRNHEADYFLDKHPVHPSPSPYHHPPEYYPPPPPPPSYHPEPEHHPPPPKYHPVPEYHPPIPPSKYYHDKGYHSYETETKYYHASDYNEPSYHKPKFYPETLYDHKLEYHPPPPPPLPLSKPEKGYQYDPPVYHPPSHHDYLPPPPPPPKPYHETDYYHEPDYYHPEVHHHHPPPPKYEYHLDVYDRKDDYKPQYYDHPYPDPYLDHTEPVEEVKHEYRKGSRSFEYGVSQLASLHVNRDALYEDAPPHGFIKAKYEPPAVYHPEPLYSPPPPPTYHS
ncbi:atrophin-1-like isoform X1 [Homarus americanus]|uniref:atrophin-1-like isoform X1 n=1 Tax=Homarus americanus TaxID=6706 RepID=UPI001C495969|nr:atrophin-1-like isoform X1 [Homarus americanus]XP_042230489.1 atrophin-1-like isoform X1 [Homarus americanus]XP_042230490.1 atrophin-1-like isoform X1 [Homarus americanus]